ncbi:MAG: hypothetical protein ACKO96_00515, partial [Flammeovirgaceae bacterium]
MNFLMVKSLKSKRRDSNVLIKSSHITEILKLSKNWFFHQLSRVMKNLKLSFTITLFSQEETLSSGVFRKDSKKRLRKSYLNQSVRSRFLSQKGSFKLGEDVK